ncbi:MAG: hypothetical protein ACOCQR_01930 [bacterium]
MKGLVRVHLTQETKDGKALGRYTTFLNTIEERDRIISTKKRIREEIEKDVESYMRAIQAMKNTELHKQIKMVVLVNDPLYKEFHEEYKGGIGYFSLKFILLPFKLKDGYTPEKMKDLAYTLGKHFLDNANAKRPLDEKISDLKRDMNIKLQNQKKAMKSALKRKPQYSIGQKVVNEYAEGKIVYIPDKKDLFRKDFVYVVDMQNMGYDIWEEDEIKEVVN